MNKLLTMLLEQLSQQPRSFDTADKINLFMKGQDTDLDQIYEKFGVDYNLLALLMRRELDEEGKFQIRWGEQMIA